MLIGKEKEPDTDSFCDAAQAAIFLVRLSGSGAEVARRARPLAQRLSLSICSAISLESDKGVS